MAVSAAEQIEMQAKDVQRQSVMDEPAPTNDAAPVQYLKLFSGGFSFFVAGVNDSSIGVLIPYITRHYNIGTGLVSIVYATTFLGWLVALLSNSYLSARLNLTSMLLIGAASQLLAHVLRSTPLPFPVFAITFFLVSLGQAYQDTHMNAFVATGKVAHRLLGFIHASYAAGLLVGPFAATPIAARLGPGEWNLFYTLLVGLGVLNVGLVLVAFRDVLSSSVRADGRHRADDSADEQDSDQVVSTGMGRILKSRNVWTLSIFYFFYLGAVITASGWIVEYLVTVRDGALSQMGYVSAGFNGGTLLGRILLSEPTHRFGERWMILLYTSLSVGFQLIFWLVPQIVAASIAVAVMGFLLGPLFSAGMTVAARLFPDATRTSSIAFVFVLGQAGGSIFPIVTGVVSSRAGVQVLQPILVALLVLTVISWLAVPKRGAVHVN